MVVCSSYCNLTRLLYSFLISKVSAHVGCLCANEVIALLVDIVFCYVLKREFWLRLKRLGGELFLYKRSPLVVCILGKGDGYIGGCRLKLFPNPSAFFCVEGEESCLWSVSQICEHFLFCLSSFRENGLPKGGGIDVGRGRDGCRLLGNLRYFDSTRRSLGGALGFCNHLKGVVEIGVLPFGIN